ncbi:MAG: hypothetical protein Q9225_000956 [Loekoesia sp. 1 TL-2023]
MSLGKTYDSFVEPIRNDSGPGFDVHIYFHQDDEGEAKFAEGLRGRIMREFEELQTYKMHYKPIGPHPIGMFEVDIATPAQFGAFVPWLAIHHGPLSILVHTNTGDGFRDHTQNAMWIGEKLPLNLSSFKKSKEMDEVGLRLKALQNMQD